MIVVDRRGGDHRRIGQPIGGRRIFRIAEEARAVACFLKGNATLIARVGAQDELVEPVDPLLDGEMVAVGRDVAQVDAVGAGDDGVPFARARRVGFRQAEVHMVVVGEDPQLSVGRVELVLPLLLARGDERQRLGRIVGGYEADLAGGIVARADDDEGPVLRPADAHRKAELLGLLVERDVLVGRRAEPVEARAIAAPLVVDLVEDDPVRAVRPDRMADRDVRDGLDILTGCEITDAQGESLGPAVVDMDGGEPSVGTHLRARPGGNIPCPLPRRVRHR